MLYIITCLVDILVERLSHALAFPLRHRGEPLAHLDQRVVVLQLVRVLGPEGDGEGGVRGGVGRIRASVARGDSGT